MINVPETAAQRKPAALKYLRLVAGLAVSVLFGWLALRDVDYREAAEIVRQVDLQWVAVGVLLLTAGVAAKALRWQLLFGPGQAVRWVDLLSAMLIGFLVNTLLPARLGEVARIYLVSRRGRAAPAHILSTIVVERVLDVLTLLVFLATVILVLPMPSFIQQSTWLLGLGTLLVFGMMIGLALRADHGLSLFAVPLRLLPSGYQSWLTRQLEKALSGLDILRNPRVHLAAWGWSVLIWCLAAGTTFAIMLAFHLPVPAATAVLLEAVLSLGMVIPSSPGYLGVYHFLAVQTLAPFGVPSSTALSFAVILHLLNFGSLSLGGLVCLAREGIQFSDLNPREMTKAR
jgi:uncharacterized protein (TIRG00374 family)